MEIESNKEKFSDLRRRAQGFVKPAAENLDLSSEEIKRLVEELNTYQIELEMQNEDLRQAQIELEQSRRKYVDLYDFAPVGYLTLSDTGLIMEANLTAADMMNVEKRYLFNQPLSSFIVPEDQKIYYRHRHLLFTGKDRQSFELRIRGKNGEQFWAKMDCLLLNYGGEIQVRITISDITESKQVEEALQKAHDNLEQRVLERTAELKWANEVLKQELEVRKLVEEALRESESSLEKRITDRTEALQKTYEQLLHAEKLAAIGSLSASIAHEFNNPLQGVLNIIKGVSRRASLDEEDTELMKIAVSECYRMGDLIRSLQDFNRPTSGKLALMDIHTTMDSILLLLKKEYNKRGIIIEKIYDKNMPQVKAVADQIKQVFLNLLNNAAYACKGGGTITIRTEAYKEIVYIRIRDTGGGIKSEDKDHIFEPFFTTKPEVKGTGLGLSVSYGIIKKHGGNILVENNPGKGTTFSIVLPIKGIGNAV